MNSSTTGYEDYIYFPPPPTNAVEYDSNYISLAEQDGLVSGFVSVLTFVETGTSGHTIMLYLGKQLSAHPSMLRSKAESDRVG